MDDPACGISDELWARIQPLLPVVQRRHRWPGRRRIDDRACLNGILFILVTGIGWQQLPQQLGYCSNDVTQLIPLLDRVSPIRGRVGRPRRKPRMLVADRGYDHEKYRRLLRARGIRPAIARRGVPYGPELGRWRVERTIAWLHQYRRLRIRWERRTDIHQAFLKLACCLICWRCLQRSFI